MATAKIGQKSLATPTDAPAQTTNSPQSTTPPNLANVGQPNRNPPVMAPRAASQANLAFEARTPDLQPSATPDLYVVPITLNGTSPPGPSTPAKPVPKMVKGMSMTALQEAKMNGANTSNNNNPAKLAASPTPAEVVSQPATSPRNSLPAALPISPVATTSQPTTLLSTSTPSPSGSKSGSSLLQQLPPPPPQPKTEATKAEANHKRSGSSLLNMLPPPPQTPSSDKTERPSTPAAQPTSPATTTAQPVKPAPPVRSPSAASLPRVAAQQPAQPTATPTPTPTATPAQAIPVQTAAQPAAPAQTTTSPPKPGIPKISPHTVSSPKPTLMKPKPLPTPEPQPQPQPQPPKETEIPAHHRISQGANTPPIPRPAQRGPAATMSVMGGKAALQAISAANSNGTDEASAAHSNPRRTRRMTHSKPVLIPVAAGTTAANTANSGGGVRASYVDLFVGQKILI